MHFFKSFLVFVFLLWYSLAMKAICKYVRIGLSAGVIFLWMWLFYFIRYSRHPEKYPIELRYRHVRRTAIRILKIFRTDLHMENLEEYRKAVNSGKQMLVVQNHVSVYDVLALIAITERPMIFIAKKELAKTPVLGATVKSIGCFFLDREDPRQAIKVLQDSSKYLSEGGIVAVYPEGTRNKDPENTPVAAFHAGSFKCALRGKASVVCMPIYGTFHYIERKHNYKSNPVFMKMMALHPYEDIEKKNTTEISDMCHDEIAGEIERMRAEEQAYLAEGKGKKKHAKWWKEPFYAEVK